MSGGTTLLAPAAAAREPVAREPAAPDTSFGAFVARAAAAGQLVVQPRMGFSDPRRMRAGLERTKRAVATTVGTLTIDSYTRVGDQDAARAAVAEGIALNGYPIATHSTGLTRSLLDGVLDPAFPVQVRHGSSRPEAIIRALAAAGLDATEGGPVSYCLPYGRTPARRVRGELGPLLRTARLAGARPPVAAPGELRRLHARPTVPARTAGGAEPAGGPVLRPARHPQRLPQLRPADRPRAGRGGGARAAVPRRRVPARRMRTGTWSSTRTWGSSPGRRGARPASWRPRRGSPYGPGRSG